MATGRKNQLVRQIGEHLVAAELGRRGFVATPFAGNVPLFDLLVADAEGRSLAVQVKAIEGASWQFNDVRTYLKVDLVDGYQHVRGVAKLPNPDLVCIFVLVSPTRDDTFYIFKIRDLQKLLRRTYKSRRRPKREDSFHCAVWPKDLEAYMGRWDILTAELEQTGGKGPGRGRGLKRS